MERHMPPDCVETLAAFLRTIKKHVGDRLALLSPGAKAGDGGIPDQIPSCERFNIAVGDFLALAVHRAGSALASR